MKRFVPVVLLVAALSACSTEVRYAPAVPATTQLPASKLPKVFLEEVVDHVGRGEYYDDTGRAQYYGRGIKSFDIDANVPWPETVRAALVLELQRLGWPLTDSASAAGARLQATIEQTRVDWRTHGPDTSLDAKVRIGLVLKDPGGRDVWKGKLESAKTYGTEYRMGDDEVPCDGCLRVALNAAFNAAIPRLGPLLAEERPWDLLGKSRAASVPAAAPEPAGPDIDELPAARAARPHSYAIVIGIEHYREKLPNADFAAGDAKLAAQYFERALGVPEANVALLTDDRASKSDFEKYFERWLPNRVAAGDTVYVYYSGHGAPNPAKGDAYLVPYDGDPTYIEETGYSVKRLFDQLAKLPAKQVYVAMDSCFSGAGGRSVIAQGARPLVTVAQADVPANLTVLAASAGNQISNSYQEKGHGLFTYFFLKGIKEKGEDLHAVFDYLKPEVSRVARREYNADQEPQWRSGK